MAPWNLALRFGLELAALIGLAFGAASAISGPVRWAAAIVVPVVAATVWATFNVVGDPSRSGRAPAVVPGWMRLVLELVILGAGMVGFVLAGRPTIAGIMATLLVLHYAASRSRVIWLLGN